MAVACNLSSREHRALSQNGFQDQAAMTFSFLLTRLDTGLHCLSAGSTHDHKHADLPMTTLAQLPTLRGRNCEVHCHQRGRHQLAQPTRMRVRCPVLTEPACWVHDRYSSSLMWRNHGVRMLTQREALHKPCGICRL